MTLVLVLESSNSPSGLSYCDRYKGSARRLSRRLAPLFAIVHIPRARFTAFVPQCTPCSGQNAVNLAQTSTILLTKIRYNSSFLLRPVVLPFLQTQALGNPLYF